MFLKHMPTGNLVEIIALEDAWDPCKASILGRFHAGEELQETELFTKAHLCFPSGESLPRCWIEAGYRRTMHEEPMGAVHQVPGRR